MIANDSFEFVWLSSSDARALKNELRELALAAYGALFYKLSAEGAERLEHGLRNDETWETLLATSSCLVYRSRDKIAGMAFLISSGNPWRFFEAGWSYIRMIAVLPGYERQGIGTKLTQMCIDLAVQRNEKVIALHTSEFQEARGIYERLGFSILEEVEPQWAKRYWLYTLNLHNESD